MEMSGETVGSAAINLTCDQLDCDEIRLYYKSDVIYDNFVSKIQIMSVKMIRNCLKIFKVNCFELKCQLKCQPGGHFLMKNVKRNSLVTTSM